MEHFNEYMQVILMVLGVIVPVASIIISGTETPAEGTKLYKLYKIVEYLALVFGKAKQLPKKG